MEPLFITVYGTPQPQGSARAFIPKGWTRPVITSSNPKMKPWRQQIAGAAVSQIPEGMSIPDTAVYVEVTFVFCRPKSTPKKQTYKTTRPDLDKLSRGVLDALTKVAFKDDSQVVQLSSFKTFGEPERTEICVRYLG